MRGRLGWFLAGLAIPLAIALIMALASASTSQAWAGYVHEGPARIVSATWTMPHVTCTQADTSLFVWTGFDGFTGPNHGYLAQTGTGAECRNGRLAYTRWMYTLPNKEIACCFGHAVPGHSYTGTVADLGHGRFQISLTDNTCACLLVKRTATRAADTANPSVLSAEAIVEVPAGYPAPAFEPVRFTNFQVDGKTPTDPVRVDLENGHTFTPSPFTGGGFTVSA